MPHMIEEAAIMGESKPKSTEVSSGSKPIEAVGTAVAALVVVSATGWLLARAKHAREALKAARDAEAARASVQRTSSPTAGMA